MKRDARRADSRRDLPESRDLKSLCDSALDAFLLVSDRGAIQWYSRATEAIFDYDRNSLLGKRISLLVPSIRSRDPGGFLKKVLGRTMTRALGQKGGTVGRRRDGTLLPVSVVVTRLQGGARKRFGLAITDISLRRSAEMGRDQAEERNRALLRAVPDLIFRTRADGTILDFVPSAETEPYVQPHEFLGRKFLDLLPRPLAREMMKVVRKTLRTGETQVFEYNLPTQGVPADFEARVTPCAPNEIMWIARKTTEKKRAEEELLRRRLIRAQEDERRRIARELHDDLNQRLALLTIELDRVALGPQAAGKPIGKRIRAVSGKIRDLSSAVHQLSHELHPAKLEQLGLVATVRGVCRHVTRQDGIDITFSHRGTLKSLPNEIALSVYRIVQEALRNMVKHSGARRGAVSLRQEGRTLLLDVRDDGRGFDVGRAKMKAGLGLVGMEERLRHVGGTLSVESHRARGTRLKVRIPLAGRKGSG